jgi:hypothetical protein
MYNNIEDEIGQEIETFCPKCKTEMVHRITVIKDDKIRKVMCNGCLTEHVYKQLYEVENEEEGEKRKPGRPRKVETIKGKRGPRKKNWSLMVGRIDEAQIVDYDIKKDFSETPAIRHKKFGVGVITKVLADNKIEVLFQDDTKILAQNWK